MDNVVPVGGGYSKFFLDQIHNEIVDHRVEVEIKRKEVVNSFPLPVFIHIKEGGRNLAREFLERG